MIGGTTVLFGVLVKQLRERDDVDVQVIGTLGVRGERLGGAFRSGCRSS